ncbi:hypothetical protein [Escherichia coli]|uniref:hypothetical protein n=1 Tax=Escherichia coli TaxID=562 RepID=UPI00028BEE87|nr:hypothetical protein [Escherichia coli]EKJ83074.1 hypothetical protein ECAD30_15240 [Escherichia coli AD30]
MYTFREFPAPAGINRQSHADNLYTARVPRASGDKPGESVSGAPLQQSSPRQRG